MKKENVLLLNMSTFTNGKQPKGVNHYYSIGEAGSFIFEGIGQLEAGTKYILSVLLTRGETIDRIVVTGSPETYEKDEETGNSPMSFYIERILGFLRGGAERETTEGNELCKTIRAKLEDLGPDDENKRNVKGAKQICEAAIVNDAAFMKRLVGAYSDKNEAFIIPVRLEGVGTKDAGTISELSARILGDSESVNVYMDIQGGDRAFMYVLNALMALTGEEKIDVKAAISTKYYGQNIVNEITNSIDSFQLVELITAMKAFTNYGRGDLLVRYFDERGYAKESETGRFVNLIKEISDAIQISDPTALTDAINRMSELIRDNKSFEDPYLSLVGKDIFEDFRTMLESPLKEGDKFANAANNLNIIEWCIKKGFTQQGLTLIEAKMPELYVNAKHIADFSISMDGADEKNKTEWKEKLRKTVTGKTYESNADRIVFEGLINIQSNTFRDYEADVFKAICSEISGRLIPESITEYPNTWKRRELLCRELLKGLSHEERKQIIDSISVAELVVSLMDSTGGEKTELSAGAKSVLSTIYKKNAKKADIKNKTKADIQKFVVGRFGLMVNMDISGELKLGAFMKAVGTIKQNGNGVSEDLIGRIEKLSDEMEGDFLSDTQIAVSVREGLMRMNIIEKIEEMKGSEFTSECLARVKSEELYRLTCKAIGIRKKGKEKSEKEALRELRKMIKNRITGITVYDKWVLEEVLIREWLKDRPDILEAYKKLCDIYSISDEKMALIQEQLNSSDLSEPADATLIEKYILFRDLENEREGRRKEASSHERFEIFKVFTDIVPGYKLNDGMDSYKTFAGLNNEYAYDLSQDGTGKATLKCMTKDTAAINRHKVDLLLRLHEALKRERNNSNHASEKGLRLNLRVIEYMMKAYIDLCREYVVGPITEEQVK